MEECIMEGRQSHPRLMAIAIIFAPTRIIYEYGRPWLLLYQVLGLINNLFNL